jgi:hypothetical protein
MFYSCTWEVVALMKRGLKRTLLTIMLFAAPPAFGEIIAVTGSVQLLGTAPLSLLQDALQK